MTMEREAVSIIGLGSMGVALASTMLNARYDVNVWNRTKDRPQVTRLVDDGAKLQPTPTAALNAARVIIICVLDYPTVYSILNHDDAAGALAGKTVFNLTNSTPNDARIMGRWMHDHNVAEYFDGGIMVTPGMIGSDFAFIFYSGETESQLEPYKPMLGSLGRADYIGEDTGAASLHDLALLAGMYGMFTGVMTAIGLLHQTKTPSGGSEKEQFKPSSVVQNKLNPLLQALIPLNVDIAKQIEVGDEEPHGHLNAMQDAGLKNILKACEDEGVDASGLRFISSAFSAVVAEGGGSGGMAMVAKKFFKKL